MPTTATTTNANWWKPPSASTNNAIAAGQTNTKGSSTLSDFNTFMKILSTELQNQDPTNPVSNTEYVAQMAQVQSLSQLQNMSNSITANSAYSLLGKSVTYQTIDPTTGANTTDSGMVQAVVIKDNATYIKVNGETVKVSAVQQVNLPK